MNPTRFLNFQSILDPYSAFSIGDFRSEEKRDEEATIVQAVSSANDDNFETVGQQITLESILGGKAKV